MFTSDKILFSSSVVGNTVLYLLANIYSLFASSIIFITASFLSWQSNMPMIGFLSISLTSQS